jgi:hypothetical protein
LCYPLKHVRNVLYQLLADTFGQNVSVKIFYDCLNKGLNMN